MIRKIKYLILAVLVSTVLVTAPVMEAQADISTVTVVGGTIGTIGAGLTALLPPAAVILTVGLACAGIDIYISQASEEQGLTKTEYVEQQIYNYSQLTNQSTEEIAKGLLNGVSVAKDGTLYLGQSALNRIKQIGNWITGSSDNWVVELPVVSTDYYIGNIPVSFVGSYTTLQNGSYTENMTFSNSNIYAFQYLDGDHQGYIVPCFVSLDSFTGTYTIPGLPERSFTSSSGLVWNFYVRSALVSQRVAWDGIPLVNQRMNGQELSAYIDSFSNSVTAPVSNIQDTFYGGDWSDFVGGLSLPQGYQGAIDLGVINDIEQVLEGATSYELSIDKFMEAIKEAIDEGVADIPLSIPADGTIVVTPDVPMVLTPEYEQVAPVDMPAESDRTIVIDDEALAPTEDIIDDMKLQLKDVFPFCIPFDIYDILSKFNATPEAPRIVVNFTLPLVNHQVNYTFDLSPFNDVASVLRVMELVAAVVGLAVATRSIFIRA